jgi:probable blue pigment (indigoidine) exporter
VLVTPVVAFILDAVIRNVVPGPLQLVGVVLVMTGLIVNQWAGARSAKSAASKPA